MGYSICLISQVLLSCVVLEVSLQSRCEETGTDVEESKWGWAEVSKGWRTWEGKGVEWDMSAFFKYLKVLLPKLEPEMGNWIWLVLGEEGRRKHSGTKLSFQPFISHIMVMLSFFSWYMDNYWKHWKWGRSCTDANIQFYFVDCTQSAMNQQNSSCQK